MPDSRTSAVDLLAALLDLDGVADLVMDGVVSRAICLRAMDHADPVVRLAAARQGARWVSIMRRAVTDKDAKVREQAAHSGATPPMVLACMMDDPSPMVRRAMVANPRTPRFVLEHLIHDADRKVRSLCESLRSPADVPVTSGRSRRVSRE